MESNAQALQRQAASAETESSGKLSIALPPPGSLDFMPLLTRYQSLHPELELNLNAQLGLSDLNKLEADVSIRFTNSPPEDYVGFKVLDLPNKLYASEAYLKKHKAIACVEDIEDWVIVSVPKADEGFESWVKEINPGARIPMRCNSPELAAEALSHDMGVTFLSKHLAKSYGNLREIPLDPFSFHMGIWLLTHRDLRFSAPY